VSEIRGRHKRTGKCSLQPPPRLAAKSPGSRIVSRRSSRCSARRQDQVRQTLPLKHVSAAHRARSPSQLRPATRCRVDHPGEVAGWPLAASTRRFTCGRAPPDRGRAASSSRSRASTMTPRGAGLPARVDSMVHHTREEAEDRFPPVATGQQTVMFLRWIWRTVVFFVGRRLWTAWQRRRQQSASRTASAG